MKNHLLLFVLCIMENREELDLIKKRMEESPEDQIKTLQSKIALLKAVGHM